MENSSLVYCIIVTYNAEKWIEKCFNSVLNSTCQCSIIVVDNDSSDNTCSIIQSKYPSVQLIKSKVNLGFGKANNIGIQQAYNEGADYFFLLNQDAWVEPDTIEQLIHEQKAHPEYGILSPLQFYENGILDKKFESYLSKHVRDVESQSEIVSVNFVNAAVWMLNRSCVETVGVFAPIFYHYGEDQNFVHRCRLHNVKVGIYTKAHAYHERNQIPEKVYKTKLKKLLVRDKSYWMLMLLNVRYFLWRQVFFLLFKSIIEILKSIVLLKPKNIPVILLRARCVMKLTECLKQRRLMKETKAFLA